MEQRDGSEDLEAIGRVAAGVAHDFNNFLSVILVSCELLAEELPADLQAAREELAEIRRAVDSASRLTRRLLDLGRPGASSPRRVDLSREIAEVAPLLRHATGRAVKVRTRASEQPAFAVLDPRDLERVLLNLATNAAHAMPEGGELSVSVEPRLAQLRTPAAPERCWALTIEDTGVGMDAETLRHAAEPFFSTRAQSGGTGLGLSLAADFAEAAGGALRVESEPGLGTRVILLLPPAPPAG